MSYYQGGGYRQGGDLYRPNYNGGSNNSSSSSSYGRRPQGNDSRNESSRSSYPSRNTASRYQPKPSSSYHQVYSQTHGGQSDTQLWMGDLDPNWTESDISDIWASVGEAPSGVKIMRDKMGKPLYCFVTFASLAAVAAAIQKNRMQIPGTSRSFKLNHASGGEERSGSRTAGRPATEFSIFVGDLASDVTEPILFARFNKDYPGSVRQVKIMMDMGNRASKGFGFVRFSNVEAQQSALQNMNGIVIGSRPIRVGLANGGGSEAPKKGAVPDAQPVYTAPLAQQQPALAPFTDPNNTVIAIKGLTPAITKEELISHFISFGHIVYCRVNYAAKVAHVKYYLRTSAERALLHMHGFVICGCRVTLRWGREELTNDGVVRFAPVGKSSKYTEAVISPPLYGTLPSYVVFEKLEKEELSHMEFVEQSELLSTEQVDKAYLQEKENRRNYLELAL